jgi:hypothetical protein
MAQVLLFSKRDDFISLASPVIFIDGGGVCNNLETV